MSRHARNYNSEVDLLKYPREEGHCVAHHIPGSVEDEDEPFMAAMTYFSACGTDLRRGDLIISDHEAGYRNDGVAIFDYGGICRLDYGCLPKQFHVIEDGVPLDYWKNIDEKDDTKRGIDHNNIVWFNHKLVQDQCLKNIQYGELHGTDAGCTVYAVFTTFSYEGKEYRIVFDYTDNEECDPYSYELSSDRVTVVLAAFRAKLEKSDLIPFETEGISYPFDGRTLFILGVY